MIWFLAFLQLIVCIEQDTLFPVQKKLHSRDDLRHLTPRSNHQLVWGDRIERRDGTLMNFVMDATFHRPAVSLEDVGGLDVTCSEDKIVLQAATSDILSHASSNWPATDFYLITNHNGNCDADNERSAHLVESCEYAGLEITCITSSSEFADALNSFEAIFGADYDDGNHPTLQSRGFFDKIKKAAKKVGSAVKSAANTVVKAGQSLIDKVKSFISGIDFPESKLANKLERVANAVRQRIKGIRNGQLKLGDKFDDIKKALDDIRDELDDLNDDIEDRMDDFIDKATEAFVKASANIKAQVAGSWNLIIDETEEILDKIDDQLRKVRTNSLKLDPSYDLALASTSNPHFNNAKFLMNVPSVVAEGISIYCVECYSRAKMQSSGSVSWSIAEGLKDGYIEMKGDMAHSIAAGIVFNGTSISLGRQLNIFNQGLPALSIPKVFSIGPILSLDLVLELQLDLQGKVLAGAKMDMSDMYLRIPLVNDASRIQSRNLLPKFTAVKDLVATGKSSLSGGAYVDFGIAFGVSVVNKLFALEFREKMGLLADFTYQPSSPKGIDARDTCSSGKSFGLDIDVSTYIDLAVFKRIELNRNKFPLLDSVCV